MDLVPSRPQRLAQSKTARCSCLEVRRALHRHGAAGPGVGGVDVVAGETDPIEDIEVPVGQLFVREPELLEEVLTEDMGGEGALDVEGDRERLFHPVDGVVVKTAGLERLVVDGRATGEGAVADGEVNDLVDLFLAIAEGLEGGGDALVDDLEEPAAGELLELDQREVRFDPGGVAVHHQTDGAGGGDHARLGVAEAVLRCRVPGRDPRSPGRRRGDPAG